MPQKGAYMCKRPKVLVLKMLCCCEEGAPYLAVEHKGAPLLVGREIPESEGPGRQHLGTLQEQRNVMTEQSY